MPNTEKIIQKNRLTRLSRLYSRIFSLLAVGSEILVTFRNCFQKMISQVATSIKAGKYICKVGSVIISLFF